MAHESPRGIRQPRTRSLKDEDKHKDRIGLLIDSLGSVSISSEGKTARARAPKLSTKRKAKEPDGERHAYEELVDLTTRTASDPSAGLHAESPAILRTTAANSKGDFRQGQLEPKAAEQLAGLENRLRSLQEQISSQKAALSASQDPSELKDMRRKVSALEESLQATVQSLAAARLRLYSPVV